MFLVLLVFLPHIALAQSLAWFDSLLVQINALIRFLLIPLVMALAVALFIWGVIKYFIYGAGDETARSTGRAYMLYAIIGLTAIVAVWGFVNLLLQIFGVSVQTAPNITNYIP